MYKILLAFLMFLVSGEFTPAFAQMSLSTVETYLNQMRSLEGRFEQHGINGEFSEGKFYLLKPGKLQLIYQKPANQLIFTDQGILNIYLKDTQELTQMPLDQSLADVLLAEFMMINEDTFIINAFEEANNFIKLNLSKKENKDLGSLILVFQKSPLQLIQWVIIDAQGQKTVVNLYDVKLNTLSTLPKLPPLKIATKP